MPDDSEEDEAAVGNAKTFTPPPDDAKPDAAPALPQTTLPANEAQPGEETTAPPPGPPPKVDEKEHAYRAGARVAPAAPSRAEREWRGLPASQWDERKGKYAGRYLTAAALDADLKARKAAAARKASAAVLRSSVDAEAARSGGDDAAEAEAEAVAAAAARAYRNATAAKRAQAAAAPKRGGGGGPRGLRKANALALQREGLQDHGVADAHPHFRQALRAQGLRKDSVTPSRPRAEMLRRCEAEVAVGAEETRYAVKAAARRAQPEWHREAHTLAARCEAKALPSRRGGKRGSGRPATAPAKSQAPAVAQANGRWPLASADGRWRPAAAGADGNRADALEPAFFGDQRAQAAQADAAAAAAAAAKLPELIVFSCDETLYEGEVWLSSSGPPYTPSVATAGAVEDSGGQAFALRKDALRILREVTSMWPQRRGASRLCLVASTSAEEWTTAALKAMRIRPGPGGSLAAAAGSVQMCGGDSVKPALRALQKERNAMFGAVLFVGERLRDVRAAAEVGCVALHCPGGMSRASWRAALQLFERETR